VISSAVLPKKPKLKKDPDVDTSFLPDKYVLLTAVLNDHLLILFLYISVPGIATKKKRKSASCWHKSGRQSRSESKVPDILYIYMYIYIYIFIIISLICLKTIIPCILFIDADEILEVSYSYWDGSGHRNKLNV
jgi:hypothetical protein